MALSPKANSDSLKIEHNFGLRESNVPRQNTGTFKNVIVNKLKRDLHDLLCIPLTDNDRAWKRICGYSGF